eukprot:12566157-Alexandrium_andersonii.AAC.1
MSPMVRWAASISRNSHQHPTTKKLRGPRGPPPAHGAGAAGSWSAEASGNGAVFRGGPSPR